MELPIATILPPTLPTVESKPALEKSPRTARRTLFTFFPHHSVGLKSSPLSVLILAQPYVSNPSKCQQICQQMAVKKLARVVEEFA
jgi:hypothetical protein